MTTSLPHPRSGKAVPRFRVFLLALAFGALPVFGNTITVTNTNDNVSGSLRAAIAAAMPGDTINFKLPNPSTITLTSGMLTIDKNLTITGPGAAQLAIDGNQAGRVFYILSGVTAGISGVTIQNGLIDNNGGGIDNQGTLTLTNSTLSHNSVGNGSEGGAIYNAGAIALIDSTVSDNVLPNGDGAGIGNDGTATLTNSTVARNSSSNGFGGGIANYGTLTITNSTLSGNSSLEGGGAILNGGVALALTNSTVSGNSSPGGAQGSGILNDGPLTVKSTLFAGNTTAGNCYLVPGSTVTSLGYNLSDDSSCAFSGPGDENNVVAGAGLDPKGLQSNGGPTQTVALLPGSPAVDHIPVPNCTDASGKPVTTDQRGVSRPQGKGCDVGAYELIEAVPFSSFNPSLAINDGKHPGFVLTSTFTLGSASTGLNPATEAMTLDIASYTLTLPAGSFHKLWNASDAPYGYEGTVNGATVVLGLIPLGNNTYSFDAAGSPVTFAGIKNPVTVTLTFGNDTGTKSVQALLTSF